jgi:hypothetical protein
VTDAEVRLDGQPPDPSRDDAWIIVCEHFHGALGPIATERLAAELAALVSEIGECNYRPVRLSLAQGYERRPDDHMLSMPYEERPR